MTKANQWTWQSWKVWKRHRFQPQNCFRSNTPTTKNHKEELRKHSPLPWQQKKIKHLGINPTEGVKVLYSENCKITDERNQRWRRWRDIPHSWVGRIHTVKMTTPSKPADQVTDGIFHRIRTDDLTICKERQKTPNSQRHPEKEQQSWSNQGSRLQTILQSCSLSRQQGTDTKIEG